MTSLKKTSHRRPSPRGGFTLVEVLIATLIMVMSIATVTAAVRQFAIHKEKLRHYEQLYTTVLSLRDRVMNDNLSDNLRSSGKLNGLDYRYECRLLESNNNYVTGEDVEQSGNRGAFAIQLFKVKLKVEGNEFEFHKTQYNKRFEAAGD
jgi:type II secretory pathway pseudopilin PulG